MLAPSLHRTVLAVLLAMIFLAAPATAMQLRNVDIDDQIDRVDQEFERTEALLQHVGGMIQDSNSPRVRDLFDQAVKLQFRGRNLLQRARTETVSLSAGNYVREALSLTLKARDVGQHAGSLLREQIGLEEQARRVIERAQELLQRGSDADVSVDAQTARIVAEARRQLLVARDHFADRNFEIALRLGESSLKLLQGVANDLRGDGQGGRLEQEIERTERLLQRARDNADTLDDTGKTMLRRATRLVGEARAAARNREPRRAVRLVQEARKLLRGLIEHGLEDVGADDVRRGTARFDAALERLREFVGDRGSPEIDRLVEQAIQAREEALRKSAAGDHDGALAQLRAGLDLLGRARRLAGGRR